MRYIKVLQVLLAITLLTSATLAVACANKICLPLETGQATRLASFVVMFHPLSEEATEGGVNYFVYQDDLYLIREVNTGSYYRGGHLWVYEAGTNKLLLETRSSEVTQGILGPVLPELVVVNNLSPIDVGYVYHMNRLWNETLRYDSLVDAGVLSEEESLAFMLAADYRDGQ